MMYFRWRHSYVGWAIAAVARKANAGVPTRSMVQKTRGHAARRRAAEPTLRLHLHGDHMSTASISRRLSGWVAGLAHSDIPPEVIDRARGVTLQALSSCLLGHDFPETRQAIRLVEEE